MIRGWALLLPMQVLIPRPIDAGQSSSSRALTFSTLLPHPHWGPICHPSLLNWPEELDELEQAYDLEHAQDLKSPQHPGAARGHGVVHSVAATILSHTPPDPSPVSPPLAHSSCVCVILDPSPASTAHMAADTLSDGLGCRPDFSLSHFRAEVLPVQGVARQFACLHGVQVMEAHHGAVPSDGWMDEVRTGEWLRSLIPG